MRMFEITGEYYIDPQDRDSAGEDAGRLEATLLMPEGNEVSAKHEFIKLYNWFNFTNIVAKEVKAYVLSHSISKKEKNILTT